ncbi:MAG: glycerol-3-phosphate 1-O-acyltransferase PlsY [Proteobacteria bacterium]|nr:glycerol-3-phosphate 1-O-acyltransferase PlsY [Pseudomonadota bacterium]
MIFFYQFLFLILTYFVAAIPFGLVLTKIFAKKDVREFGSGNIGATNVVRVAGKKIGLLTLVLDGLKGAIMVVIARFAFFDVSGLHIFLVLVGAVSVLAHIYPIYLNFKGGKGVATTLAVLLALDPNIGLFVILIWAITFAIFRTSSISSITAIFSSIILSICYGTSFSQILFCVLLFALILYRHKENLLRLKSGEEKKF